MGAINTFKPKTNPDLLKMAISNGQNDSHMFFSVKNDGILGDADSNKSYMLSNYNSSFTKTVHVTDFKKNQRILKKIDYKMLEIVDNFHLSFSKPENVNPVNFFVDMNSDELIKN